MLGKVPLLAGLSKRDLERVLGLGEEVVFTPGTVIVQAGDQAQDFYVLLEGEALVTVPGGKRARLGPGSHFGEMAVLDAGPRSATIAAETQVVGLRIGRPNFLA